MGAVAEWHNGMQFHERVGFLTPGKDYWYVDFGPIPNKPAWHEQSRPSSYPFPHEDAAFCFAHAHKYRDPARPVAVRHPDGTVDEIDPIDLGDMEDEVEPVPA